MDGAGLLSGATVMAALVIALFFLRFWRHTGDRFFLLFAIAFTLEALQRLLLGLHALQDADGPVYYLLRLLAYVLIIAAVVDKNRGGRADPP